MIKLNVNGQTKEVDVDPATQEGFDI